MTFLMLFFLKHIENLISKTKKFMFAKMCLVHNDFVRFYELEFFFRIPVFMKHL